VRGADELVERLPIDPAARPFVRQGLAVDVTEKVWNVAFGLWAAWRTIDAPETTAVVEEGTDRERQVTVTSVGTDGGLAALRYDPAHGPDAAEAAVASSFPELAGAFATMALGLHDRAEVVTDPTTLWPTSTFLERVAEVDDGTEVIRRFERRSTAFDWA